MSETTKSQDFIKEQKQKYGKILDIEKIIRPDKKGEPDIRATYKGMPVWAEAKLVNKISCKNTHPFTKIQIDTLEQRSLSGAMCIGLLYKGKEIKYLMYNQLKEYITKEDWDNAEVFDWEILWSRWMQSIQTNF